ncbi:hypothetical protein AciPR4_3355 [Terriglobus saanensis SP1PR4]|uniref:Uncharacterized protein n=1 Tax=Terriglobus saanensis (strain ATCC BAA-1853 / DSM 23119 / SP1PR4) TaxID=401053 RepID=E8V8S2_TERSS|nr:hypothetical protein AciPR4_3355 [Terriglobus saanensis SP1PR4]
MSIAFAMDEHKDLLPDANTLERLPRTINDFGRPVAFKTEMRKPHAIFAYFHFYVFRRSRSPGFKGTLVSPSYSYHCSHSQTG